jgi:ABC-2 type transport system ATP-binding protein
MFFRPPGPYWFLFNPTPLLPRLFCANAPGTDMSQFALEVESLVKIYQPRWARPFNARGLAVRALDGMSFNVKRGSIFGLLGPNGAGKTTLLKILTTLIRPTSGCARVEGFDVVAQPLEVRRRISSVIQETAVDLLLSVRDNLHTFARFHGLGAAEGRRRAENLLDTFQLRDEAERKVQDLSGGYRRRVQVAKVFMIETPVVFLDEFSTGMDPILKRSVMAQLRHETAKGRTIILTTQILNEAEELCDDILIINKGKQVARGDLNALKLLSEGVYEIAMTFDRLPDGIEPELASLCPLRLKVNHNSLELALKAEESRVLDLVSSLSKRGRVLRVEVSGASLEDIFVELTQKES